MANYATDKLQTTIIATYMVDESNAVLELVAGAKCDGVNRPHERVKVLLFLRLIFPFFANILKKRQAR